MYICLIYGLFSTLFHQSEGLFFGSSAGCQCCSQAPQPCPVQACVPSYSACPTLDIEPELLYTDCCAACANPCRAKQVFNSRYRRQKRQDPLQELPDERFFKGKDESTTPKCNSERLRKLLSTSTGIETSVTKRNLQLLAEKQFHHRYNVVCSSEGDFSYITSTDEFCQDRVNGKTCYIFRHFDKANTSRYHSTRMVHQ